MNLFLIFAPVVGALAVIFAARQIRILLKESRGTPKMIEISDAIKVGAQAYLARQFLVAAVFTAALTIALA